MSKCRSCSAPIRWARTENDRGIPLDRDPYTGPEPGGLFALRYPHGYAVAIAAPPEAFPDEPLYRSHFATCPQANDWRKKPVTTNGGDSRAYIRIEPRGGEQIGVAHVVLDDRLFFVDGDTEIDISSAVSAYTITSKVGDARTATLELLRIEISEMEHNARIDR